MSDSQISMVSDFSSAEAIIFDSDGVLVDSEIIHIAVEKELLSELGLEYDLQTYKDRFVGLSNGDFYAYLTADFEAAGLGTFPADFDDQLKRRVLPRIKDELRPVPGVKELLGQFSGLVAVASSAPLTRLTSKLKITGLFDLFAPHIYSSDHVENGKPAPDLFLHAAEQLGVKPSQCIVIEDSINGVLASRRANMMTVGFLGGGHVDARHSKRLSQAGAHVVVNSHMEIASLLSSHCSTKDHE